MPIRPLRIPRWSRTVLANGALVALLALATSAHAQVCGDANGDGDVNVSDGVQALRAAAQLSTTCTPATCDLDGDGTVGLADGVNVLRKAAELPAPSLCGGGNPDAEVATVTETVAPLLLFGFTSISEVDVQAAAHDEGAEPAGGFPVDVDDCPDGGTRSKRTVGLCIVNVDFDQCRYSAPQLGSFEFGEGLSVNLCEGQVLLAVRVTDRGSGRAVSFDGVFSFQPTGDGFVADGGPITITTPQGDFELRFQQLTFNDEGQPTSGTGQITDTDDNFELDSLAFTATGGATASLVATFDDGNQRSFLLNLVTGALVPA